MVFNVELVKQIMRFGIVGVCAAVVHISVVIALVEIQNLPPLLANVFAFLCSFQVSYFGHRFWTFSESEVLHYVAMPKLLLTSTLGFVANEGLFYYFLRIVGLPYVVAILVVLSILPVITFVVNRHWVFR